MALRVKQLQEARLGVEEDAAGAGVQHEPRGQHGIPQTEPRIAADGVVLDQPAENSPLDLIGRVHKADHCEKLLF